MNEEAIVNGKLIKAENEKKLRFDCRSPHFFHCIFRKPLPFFRFWKMAFSSFRENSGNSRISGFVETVPRGVTDGARESRFARLNESVSRKPQGRHGAPGNAVFRKRLPLGANRQSRK